MTTELPTIYTVGVYGSTEETFFAALVENEIELFIDIRARRGMRGPKYKYVNSAALQLKLNELGIFYAHLKELAPTKEIRALQWQADKEEKTRKRDRMELSDAYVDRYKEQILKYRKKKDELKLEPKDVLERAKLLAEYPIDKPLQRYVLFCVEANAKACHRSLVAARFKDKMGGRVKHVVHGGGNK